jgi:glycosyltransferase involved in cell wall biosynthesis
MYRGIEIAVVVPAHNEARRVGRVLATLPPFVDRAILVDDGSTDGTAGEALGAGGARVEILRRAARGGVGAAIRDGYARALERGAGIVAVMAGDAQMDPADLAGLLDPLVEGRADYAKGDRLVHPDVLRAMPAIRLLGNLILTRLTRLATGLRLSDSQCGYTAITREALGRIALADLYPRYGFPNDLLMKLAAAELRVVDVVVRPIYHPGPGASGIVLHRFVPSVGRLLAAGIARRLARRGEWARRPGRRRVLVLTSSYPRFAGDHAGSFVAQVARRLSRSSDVTVLAPRDPRFPSGEREGPAPRVVRFRYAPLARWHRVAYGAGIETNVGMLGAGSSIEVGSRAYGARDPRSRFAARVWLLPFLAAFAARALVHARGADVVVSNWLVPGGAIGALTRKLLGRPHLAIEHGGGLWALRSAGGAGRRLLAGILRGSDRVVCVSEALREDLLTEAAAAGVRMHARDVPVVPMGVDTRGFETGPRDRDIDVLFLGRLIPVKGVETLIDALARLPGVTLHVAGDGPLRGELVRRAAPLEGRAIFHGWVRGDARRGLLARASVLAVPSLVLPGGRTEGLPVVVLEGMAAGCAVVASDVGGIGEIVRDGWNGLLVKPGDADALADRIGWLLRHPAAREALGRRARRGAAAHDADRAGARIAAEIERIGGGLSRDLP